MIQGSYGRLFVSIPKDSLNYPCYLDKFAVETELGFDELSYGASYGGEGNGAVLGGCNGYQKAWSLSSQSLVRARGKSFQTWAIAEDSGVLLLVRRYTPVWKVIVAAVVGSRVS